MKKIDRSWIMPLIYGGLFLGSGGGGKSDILRMALERFFDSGKTVTLISPDELEDDSYYFTTAMMGSTELTEEYFISGQEGVGLIRHLSGLTGYTPQGIMGIEGITINILYTMLVAGLADLPLIDGDSMGRAFPELQMTTMHLHNLSSNPAVLYDSSGNLHEFHEEDTFLLELGIRKILFENGGVGYFAGFVNSGKLFKQIIIPNTLSFCSEIGEAFIHSKSSQDLVQRLLPVTRNSLYGSCIQLFCGVVQDIQHVQKLNWNRIHLKGKNEFNGESFTILVHNENLIAFRENKIAAMVPDIITFVDLNTLKPVQNNDIYPEMEVMVVGMPAPLVLRTQKALNIVGPQCFGYKSRYQSLEEIYFDYYFS